MVGISAIAADDDHGRAHGGVVQAHGLRWDELYALADLIASAVDVKHHGARHAAPDRSGVHRHRRPLPDRPQPLPDRSAEQGTHIDDRARRTGPPRRMRHHFDEEEP
jgi:hypothetical protein